MEPLSSDELLAFILTDYALEQHIVHAIDGQGLVHLLTSQAQVLGYWPEHTIKVQAMERYSPALLDGCKAIADLHSHRGPVTCHAYHSPRAARSFPVHTDPDDVVIYVLEGAKCMVVADVHTIVVPGDRLFIPANTPHRALNNDDSLMLSVGLERFMKDKV